MILSIIIPTYNTSNYLAELLKVLEPQITSDVEVIIVNDGSTDDTKEMLKSHKLVKVITIQNAGVSNARNVGLNRATGDYIAFIDSDDLISSNYVSKILEKIKSNYDYFFISWHAFGEKNYDCVITDFPPQWNTSVWTRVYKRSIIGSERFNKKLDFGEDDDFNKRVLKDYYSHSAITDKLYFYRNGRPESLCKIHYSVKADIIIWQSMIHRIGGIETFIYNFCKKLSKYYKILLLYNECHEEQLIRFKELVDCQTYDLTKQYICNTCIVSSCWNGYPDNVISLKNHYWQFIHGIFRDINFKYNKWEKTNKHFAVSKVAQETFAEDYKEPTELLYNLLDDVQPTKPILKLVSATRLTKEKGYDRMKILAESLKKAGIKFRWTVFTNLEDYNLKPIEMEEMVFMKSRFDIWDYIKEADYVVQLSDTEAWCYILNEGLQYGIPVISTDFGSVNETVIDGYNGYIIKKDMSNLDLDKIVNHKPTGFKYIEQTTIEDWLKLLKRPKTKLITKNVTVEALIDYNDLELNRKIKKGSKLVVTEKRAKVLIEKRVAKLLAAKRD